MFAYVAMKKIELRKWSKPALIPSCYVSLEWAQVKVIGSFAYAFLPAELHHKHQDKAKTYIFIGYRNESNNNRQFQPNTSKITIN